MSKIAFVFPGQGSQYVGMGKEMMDSCAFAASMLREAEAVCGIDIERLCLEGPLSELTITANLQPCITFVDMLCARALMEEGVRPDAVAGHSLGEYPALWASGALGFEDCLSLVKERARVMEEAARKRPGAMAAVIGLERERLQELVDQVKSSHQGVLAVANHNSREQIVATGEKALVDELCKKVKELGKKAIPLKVSGAYHSPLMDEASEEFARFLSSVRFSRPSVPVYSNVSAKAEMDPSVIERLLKEQMCKPVRWYEIVNQMYEDGVRVFVETGPKKVLSNLIRKSVDANDYEVMNVENLSDVQKVKQMLGI